MKLLRSITRRGFSVGTAGWFTVLRPNTWFPASRLPAGFHSPPIRSTMAGSSGDPDHTGYLGNLNAAVPVPALTVSAPAHHPLRMASIVLAAIATTSALLWWIMHP
jgi:hypothetical protein